MVRIYATLGALRVEPVPPTGLLLLDFGHDLGGDDAHAAQLLEAFPELQRQRLGRDRLAGEAAQQPAILRELTATEAVAARELVELIGALCADHLGLAAVDLPPLLLQPACDEARRRKRAEAFELGALLGAPEHPSKMKEENRYRFQKEGW